MSEPTQQLPNLLDDDTLSESERQFIELFQKRQPATDDGGLTSAETEPEVQGTPASPSATAAPGAPATPVEGPEGTPAIDTSGEATPAGDQGEVQSQVPPPTQGATPAQGESTPGEPAPSAGAFTFAGVEYTPEQITNAIRVNDWFSRLDDNQIRAVDAVLSGQYVLAPAHEASPTQAPPTPVPAAGVPAQPSPPVPSSEGAGEWLDPRAEAEINALKQLITQQNEQLTQFQQRVQQSLTPVVQSQQDQVTQQHIAAIDRGAAAFKDQYSLDDSTMEQVQQAVVAAGIFPSLITRHNGDIEAAMKAGLDMMFWTTPQFRDSHLQARAAAELATLNEQNNSQQRKETLTALSSSGGSVPRRDPVPTDRDGRYRAMVDAIAADQNGQ